MLPKNNRVATFIIEYLHVKGKHVTGTNNTKILLRLYKLIGIRPVMHFTKWLPKLQDVSRLVCVYLVHPVFTFVFVAGNSSL